MEESSRSWMLRSANCRLKKSVRDRGGHSLESFRHPSTARYLPPMSPNRLARHRAEVASIGNGPQSPLLATSKGSGPYAPPALIITTSSICLPRMTARSFPSRDQAKENSESAGKSVNAYDARPSSGWIMIWPTPPTTTS